MNINTIKEALQGGVVTIFHPQGLLDMVSVHIEAHSVFVNNEGNGQVHFKARFLNGGRKWFTDRLSTPIEGHDAMKRWFNFDVKDYEIDVNITTNNKPIPRRI